MTKLWLSLCGFLTRLAGRVGTAYSSVIKVYIGLKSSILLAWDDYRAVCRVIRLEGSGAFGSLKGHVAHEVRRHRRTNPALVRARYPIGQRLLRAMLGERTLIRFSAGYAFLLVCALVAEATIATLWPSILPELGNANHIKSLLDDVTSYLLGAQATLIGLVFPVAIGMVTIIIGRGEASSTDSDIRIYYHESMALTIGLSSILLVAVLSIQLVWPAQFLLHKFNAGSSSIIFKIFLTSIHIMWFSFNALSLGFFLYITLVFVHPDNRGEIRQKYAGNSNVIQDIRESYMDALFLGVGINFLVPAAVTSKDRTFTVLIGFGSLFSGSTEIRRSFQSERALHDVWLIPIAWAIRRWWRRCQRIESHRSAHAENRHIALALPISLDVAFSGTIALFERSGGVPFFPLELWLIRQCFRFDKVHT